MASDHSPYRVSLRLAPSVLVVVCWFIIQDNIEMVTSCRRPFLAFAILGAIYVIAPLCTYAWRFRTGVPRDFWVALVVSLLGLVYATLGLVGMAFWSGSFVD